MVNVPGFTISPKLFKTEFFVGRFIFENATSIYSVIAPPVAWQVVRVPTKIGFVGSSLPEWMLARPYSCTKYKHWLAESARA